MLSILIWKTKRVLQNWDWTLTKGSALLSTTTAVARALGLLFSLVLAAAFSPADYGVIRYLISVSMIVAIVTQPFGQHVLARFASMYKEDDEKLRHFFTNSWFILIVLCGLTLLIAVPTLSLMGKLNIGIFVIFGGVTLFYCYWGLSAGFQAPRQLAAAYLGSNLVQIALVLFFIRVLEIKSTTLALSIYGLSYLLPLTLLQRLWPLPVRAIQLPFRRDVISEMVRFSLAIWASHACYVLYFSLDMLLLEHFGSAEELGAYALAKTLASVFLFVPQGISALLMPKVAASCGQICRPLLKQMLVLSFFINSLFFVVYLLLINWFTLVFVGSEYKVETGVSVALAISMIASGAHSVITAVVVGSGRTVIETISRASAVVAAALVGWVLIPVYGPLGAAGAMLTGAVAALAIYLVIGSKGST